MAPHIQIIIGGIREGRVGEPVARWFAELVWWAEILRAGRADKGGQ